MARGSPSNWCWGRMRVLVGAAVLAAMTGTAGVGAGAVEILTG